MAMNIREVKTVLRSILVSSSVPLKVFELNRDFFDLEGKPIPFAAMGYDSLADFLMSIPDILTVSGKSRDSLVTLVKSDKSAHVSDLVSKQKTSRKLGQFSANTSRRTRERIDPKPKYIQEKFKKVNEEIPGKKSSHSGSMDPGTKKKLNFLDRLNVDLRLRPAGTLGERQKEKTVQTELPTESAHETLFQNWLDENVKRFEKEKKYQCRKEGSWRIAKLAIANITFEKPKKKEVVPESIQLILQKLVSDHPDGLWCAELPAAYRKLTGNELQFEEYGYKSLKNMCLDLGDILHCVTESSSDIKLYDARRPFPQIQVTQQEKIEKKTDVEKFPMQKQKQKKSIKMEKEESKNEEEEKIEKKTVAPDVKKFPTKKQKQKKSDKNEEKWTDLIWNGEQWVENLSEENQVSENWADEIWNEDVPVEKRTDENQPTKSFVENCNGEIQNLDTWVDENWCDEKWAEENFENQTDENQPKEMCVEKNWIEVNPNFDSWLDEKWCDENWEEENFENQTDENRPQEMCFEKNWNEVNPNFDNWVDEKWCDENWTDEIWNKDVPVEKRTDENQPTKSFEENCNGEIQNLDTWVDENWCDGKWAEENFENQTDENRPQEMCFEKNWNVVNPNFDNWVDEKWCDEDLAQENMSKNDTTLEDYKNEMKQTRHYESLSERLRKASLKKLY